MALDLKLKFKQKMHWDVRHIGQSQYISARYKCIGFSSLLTLKILCGLDHVPDFFMAYLLLFSNLCISQVSFLSNETAFVSDWYYCKVIIRTAGKWNKQTIALTPKEEGVALMRQQDIVQIPFDIHWNKKVISTKILLQSHDKEQCYFRTSYSAHQLSVSEVLWGG